MVYLAVEYHVAKKDDMSGYFMTWGDVYNILFKGENLIFLNLKN